MKKTTVLIADDHKLFREMLGCMINKNQAFEVIASCGDSTETLETTKIENPDIILMDINMRPFSGLDATEQIKQVSPATIVIGMSAHSDPAYAKKMIQRGARGYVTKNSHKEEIFTAMNAVMGGQVYICSEIKDILVENMTADPKLAPGVNSLTERELQIVHLIKEGLSSKEIAVDINVTVKTVEVHRHNILQKLKLRNSASLVTFMYKNAGHLV